ncbi:neurotrypsin-like isoform X2 [Argopecten irradians]|uniref:neurotrypsin-like isoform X2 n=1 Tax=Argopecten irradians TaxID=31199 RepID=UPI0037210370
MTGNTVYIIIAGLNILTAFIEGNILRLVGGDDQYEGRVEIYNDGEWQSACNEYWSDDDAIVACRQMGFKGGSWENDEYGNRVFWMTDFNCDGTETSLERCTSEPITSTRCRHTDDYVYLTCMPTKDGVLRLKGGRLQQEGRLEIHHDGEWGTICDDKWENRPENARVACRQLGFKGGTSRTVTSSEQSGSGVGYWMDEVNCLGNETVIQHCSFEGWGEGDCYSRREQIYLKCDELKDNQTRLVGGTNQYEGRLEVYHAGQWGSVCIHQWESFVLNAQVACRQLGYTAGSFRPVMTDERGYGPFWMEGIECDGDEVNLQSCNFKAWESNNCSHGNNDGIFLYCNPLKGAVQLADGTNRYNGVVQVFRDGKWTSYCSDDWTDTNTNVACRQLGAIGKSNDAQEYDGYYFPGDLQCDETDEYLRKCNYLRSTCSTDKKVVVYCEIPVSPHNGSCEIDLQETCDDTLTCEEVNGFGRCICGNTKYWDTRTETCKENYVHSTEAMFNEICDPLVNDMCNKDLKCESANGSGQFSCVCRENNTFWDPSFEQCFQRITYGGECDPNIQDICTSDMSCERETSPNIYQCICPNENEFWDSAYLTCRDKSNLQGIYINDKLNISDAIAICKDNYHGHLATTEHRMNIFANCTDFVEDIWLIDVLYSTTENQSEGCAMLNQDGDLILENCTGSKEFICISKRNNTTDPSCRGFPTPPSKSFQGASSTNSGLIAGLVLLLVILAVVSMLVIWMAIRRRRNNVKRKESKGVIDNQAYGTTGTDNGDTLRMETRSEYKSGMKYDEEYYYAATGNSNQNYRSDNNSNIYVNETTEEQYDKAGELNQGVDNTEYANYVQDHPPNGVSHNHTLKDPISNLKLSHRQDISSLTTDDPPDEEYNTFADRNKDIPPSDTYDHVNDLQDEYDELRTSGKENFTEHDDLPPSDTYDHVHEVAEDGYDQFNLKSSKQPNFTQDDETGYMQSTFPG